MAVPLLNHMREDFETERHRMVESQLVSRGISHESVLNAMRSVPREMFIDEQLAEFAYHDTPLPIAEGQTISQPYIVALMAEMAELTPVDRVLEIGTGSGYAAAVYAQIAEHVYTIERHERLAETAAVALAASGVHNVTVRTGDGTLGWEERAPFDAIIVAAGAPRLPDRLKRQLAAGGRMIIPVNVDGHQQLIRVRREPDDTFPEEDLGAVMFVPLIGAEGWSGIKERTSAGGNSVEPMRPERQRAPVVLRDDKLVEALREAAEPLPEIESASFGAMFDRLGDATIAALGEATHGTSEFYRARAAITRRLVEKHGFRIIAVEADWPDAARIDRYIRHREKPPWEEAAFTRFPAWMWRNREMLELIEWLRDYNAELAPAERVSFHGLDLYALATSISAVLAYLRETDPATAEVAKERYACLTPWQKDPAAYGRAALTRGFETCESAAVANVKALLEQRTGYSEADPDDYLDAEGNARLVAAAEQYYRLMYYSDARSWNLRDQHMFETLERVRAARPDPGKAVVWAHNSHIGDAKATEMGVVRDEINLGQLCRERYGTAAALVGFGTYGGEVMAANNWDEPGQVYQILPARRSSIEALCHRTEHPSFLLDLGRHAGTSLALSLLGPRLQRAIGVIYRPETERASHYLECSLQGQFDYYVWFDETHAVDPIPGEEVREGAPETYPFGV